MKKVFSFDELKTYVKEKKFKDQDRIYCKEYPSLIFIYETEDSEVLDVKNFTAYSVDGHDLYGDGSLTECIKDSNNCIFSTEPFSKF